MEQRSDHELIEQARLGDSGAFDALAQRHYMFIYSTAYKWCGTREEAQDTAQEVLIKLARAIHEFDARSRFTTWLYRVTINAAKDMIKKKTRDRKRDEAYAEIAAQDTGQQTEAGACKSSLLYRLIGTLAPKFKDAILLVYAQGLDHRAAAQVLGCAETTISWRVFQAKRMLEKLAKKAKAYE